MATADVAARTAGIDPAAPRPPVGFRVQRPEAWTTAYLHTSQLVAVPSNPGARRTTALTQFLVPVPDLPWLGVVTAATTDPELADAIADGVAHTLEFRDPPGVAEPRRRGIGT